MKAGGLFVADGFSADGFAVCLRSETDSRKIGKSDIF
jgi:hypothetical protein